MAKNNFLLVDLNDKKMKQLGETITSQSSRTILSILSEDSEGKSESQIAKETGLKLTTVHYNLQKLQEAQLVESTEFKYSSKGREVKLYSLANKYIIIAPKKVTGIRAKLREILPVGLVILGIGAVIEWITRTTQIATDISTTTTNTVISHAAESAFREKSAEVSYVYTSMPSQDLAVPILNETVVEVLEVVTVPWWQQVSPALYFIAGATIALGLYLAYKKYLASRKS